MALKKNSIKVRKIFLNSVRDLHCGRSSIRSDRYAAERNDRLRHNRLCQRNACNCEACRIYGMSVNNRSDIRSLFVYS